MDSSSISKQTDRPQERFLDELRKLLNEAHIPLDADPELIQTETVKTIRAKIEYAWSEHFPFAVITGPAGVGKTATLKSLITEKSQLYIRAYPGYSAPAMVEDIARQLRISQIRQFRVLIGIVLDALRANPRLIALDDIETIPRETLGVAKYLADESGSTFVICTMDEYLPQIRRYRDIDSRIGVIAEAHPATLAELRKIYDESGFSKGVLAEIHAVTGGIIRDVLRLVRYFDQGLENAGLGRKDLTVEWVRPAASFLHFTGGR